MNDTAAKFKTQCPCCHGVTYLLVYDDERPNNPPVPVMCCHCQGEGSVPSEVEDGTQIESEPR